MCPGTSSAAKGPGSQPVSHPKPFLPPVAIAGSVWARCQPNPLFGPGGPQHCCVCLLLAMPMHLSPFVWGLLLDHNCLQALLCSHTTVPSDFLIEHKCKKENIKNFKTAEQNIKPSAGVCRASLVAQLVKNLSAMKETGSIPGLGRSPGGGNGNPLQYSCLESPMNRGAWQATVHGVARVGHNLVTKPPPQACVNGQMIRA